MPDESSWRAALASRDHAWLRLVIDLVSEYEEHTGRRMTSSELEMALRRRDPDPDPTVPEAG